MVQVVMVILPYDVIKAIRQRAGITGADPILSQKVIKTRCELIHNERRLSLVSKDSAFGISDAGKKDITEPAKGMRIEGGNYNILDLVERRAYQDYMYYGPIPYGEVIKFDKLLQNKGW